MSTEAKKRPLHPATWFAFLGIWLLLGSCEYVERFYLVVNENRSPCVGVVKMSFSVQDGNGGQELKTTDKIAESAQPGSLLWNIQTGKCQDWSDGVALKQVDYGELRKMVIKGFDSSGTLVAMGASPVFQMDPSSPENRIFMDLVRGCQSFTDTGCSNTVEMGYGTLVIRFPASAQLVGVSQFSFKLVASNPQQPVNFTRSIPIVGQIPSFIVLTNVPTGDGRKYVIEALSATQQPLQKWGGTYTLKANLSPQTGTLRIEAQPQSAP